MASQCYHLPDFSNWQLPPLLPAPSPGWKKIYAQALANKTERGCVADQPQHVGKSEGARIIHALRLTLRAQPRSTLVPTGTTEN
jgi:hypothetical protein